MMRDMSLRIVGLILCSSILACGGTRSSSGSSASTPAQTASQASNDAPLATTKVDPKRWAAFVSEFIEASLARDPSFATYQGRHEFDGQVADLSLASYAANIAELQQFHERALAFKDDELDAAQRFEREYLVANIDSALFWLVRMEQQRRSPLVYSNVIDPSVYLTRAYAPLDQRMRAYIAHARHIPRVIEQMKANLRLPLPRTFVEVGIKVFGGMGPYLEKDVLEIFKDVSDPALQKELREVNAPAAAATKDATAWLKAQLKSADDKFALGPDLFRELLWATERVDTPLEELEAVGKRDLEANLAALNEACGALLPGKPLKKCIELVGKDKPKDGPVAGARAQLDALRAFVLEKDLVTIPGPELALVEEAPPYKRWNQAYIEIPGPYEKGMPSVYYIAPPDPSWSKADKLAYIPGTADLLFISVHEVWPGHFLQFLHANRSPSMFGRLYVGYAFAEGWAHYSEEMMWDAGLSEGDLKVRVGQLLNALLRNARYLSAIGLHTQGMTVAQSEKLFLEKAYQDSGNAKQQAARGTFDPAYLNYTLGKLMIRKLRDDWTREHGGRKGWRAFHDQLLSYGGPPLPLVRKAMLGDSGDLL